MGAKSSFLEALVPAIAENFKQHKDEVKEPIDLQRDLVAIKKELMGNPITASAYSMLKITDRDLLDVMRRAATIAGFEVKREV